MTNTKAKTLLEVGNWKILINDHKRVGILFKNNTQVIINESDWVELSDKIILTLLEKEHIEIKEELRKNIGREYRKSLCSVEAYLYGKIQFYGGNPE